MKQTNEYINEQTQRKLTQNATTSQIVKTQNNRRDKADHNEDPMQQRSGHYGLLWQQMSNIFAVILLLVYRLSAHSLDLQPQ